MTTIVYPDADAGVLASLARTGLDDRLASMGAFVTHPGDPADDDDFLRRVGDARVILLGSRLPDRVLREAPALEFVSFTGYGAANFVDLALAAERGIPVGITPGYGADSVAEHALALALSSARRVVEGDRAVRGGGWAMPESTQLRGRTAAIVGYGAIGARTAELFAAIGMDVVVWARRTPVAAPRGIRFTTDLSEAFAADVVSLHLALTPETAGLVTAAHLAALPDGAIVVNTARAELVEPGALEAEVRSGRLRAALDVFTAEPLTDADLLAAPGTVLTPHQGYNTPQALDALLAIAVANIDGFLAGTPIHTA